MDNEEVQQNPSECVEILIYSIVIAASMFMVSSLHGIPCPFANIGFQIDRITFFKDDYFMHYTDVKYDINFDTPNSSKCEPCNFNSVNYGANSDKHDIISTKNTGDPKNMIIFLRSLRQTGCKAQVVFFVTDNAMTRMSQDTRKYAEQCGAQFINYHRPTSRWGDDILSEPYFHMYRLLQLHKHEINRYIFVDLYDSVFQGDPFNEYLPKNAVHVVDEGWNWDFKNVGWIASCGGHYRQSRKTINSGYFGGDVEHVFNFLRVYITNFVYHTNMNDQGCVNHWVYGKLFENNGVPINNTKNNIVLHMAFLGMARKQPLGNITAFYRSDLVAAILHQTHWFCGLLRTIGEKCPPPPGDFPHYQGGCKAGW